MFTVRSDEEISAILVALDDGLAHEGHLGEADVTSPTVKDLARLSSPPTPREGGGQGDAEAPSPAAEPDPVSRALTQGFEDSEKELSNDKGAAFDGSS